MAMWNILQALSYLWTAIIGLFKKKHSTMPDLEQQLEAIQITSNDSREGVLRGSRKPHLIGNGPAPLRDACTVLTGSDTNSNPSDKVRPNQKTAKPRTHSVKYLLRQGAYIENWNSPGCELSELYGQKSPRPLSPSPLLSGFPLSTRSNPGEYTFRFPGRSPTLPADGMPCSSSSRIFRSPFLSDSTPDLDNLKSSPVLSDFSDLTQLIMKDLQAVSYSDNLSSAVAAGTFWDLPSNLVPLRTPAGLENSSSTLRVDAASTLDALFVSASESQENILELDATVAV